MLNFSNFLLKPKEVDMLLYHGDCVDGFTSAFICYFFMKTQNKRKKVKFIPCQYQKAPPNVSDKNVLICDFSFKYDTTMKLINSANKIGIIDHHASAEKDLKNIDVKYKYFDKKHSGAYLTWCYFFDEKSMPDFIRYVEDNDLGKRVLTGTKEFSSYVYSLEKKFDIYEKLMDNNFIERTVIPIGEGMLKQSETFINDTVKKIAMQFMLIDSNLYFVGTVNTAVLKSEIGNAMFDFYPNANFSACYSQNTYTGETYISLRSNDSSSDVESIASKYGGGGHRNAAGLSVFGSNMLPGILIDRYQCYNMLERIIIKTHNLIDKETEVNIVYLNSAHHKRHLGRYLLQTRYQETYDNEQREVSEACSIIRNKTKDMSYYVSLDLAGIYYYNDAENKTYFALVSDNSDLIEHIKILYKDYVVDTDDINISHRLKIGINGMVNKI
jgi:hypothetical protein